MEMQWPSVRRQTQLSNQQLSFRTVAGLFSRNLMRSLTGTLTGKNRQAVPGTWTVGQFIYNQEQRTAIRRRAAATSFQMTALETLILNWNGRLVKKQIVAS